MDQRIRISGGVILALFLWLTAAAASGDEYIRRFSYQVKKGETLESILMREIGPAEVREIYLQGWFRRNWHLNPGIRNWKKIEPGTTLQLEVPVAKLPQQSCPKVDCPPLACPEKKVCPPCPACAEVEQKCPACPECASPADPSIDPSRDQSSVDVANIVSGGYIGLRYGLSHDKGDNELLDKTTLVGLFAEFRGSALAGLRYYYDVVPVVAADVEGIGVEYGWQRHSVGYAFAWEMPAVVSRLHLTPKVGHYAIKARFPRQSGDQFHSEVFDITGALSLGLELDVEWVGRYGTARPWLGQDVSGAMLSGAVKNSVVSRRYGLDGFFDLPAFGDSGVGVALLLFVLSEDVALKGTEEDDTFEIEIGLTYYGAGISLYW